MQSDQLLKNMGRCLYGGRSIRKHLKWEMWNRIYRNKFPSPEGIRWKIEGIRDPNIRKADGRVWRNYPVNLKWDHNTR